MMKERKKEWREEEVVNLGPGIPEGWWGWAEAKKRTRVMSSDKTWGIAGGGLVPSQKD